MSEHRVLSGERGWSRAPDSQRLCPPLLTSLPSLDPTPHMPVSASYLPLVQFTISPSEPEVSNIPFCLPGLS